MGVTKSLVEAEEYSVQLCYKSIERCQITHTFLQVIKSYQISVSSLCSMLL